MSESASRHNVTALFDHPSAAQDAATALEDAGFTSESVTLLPLASEEVLRKERNQDPYVLYRGVTTPERGGAAGFVIGFLGGGLVGLMMGAGALHMMGMEPAVAAGPFWSAVTGALLLGFGCAFMGFTFNSPLNKPQPPTGMAPKEGASTIVTVAADAQGAEQAREALERQSAAKVTTWQADNGDWAPVASG